MDITKAFIKAKQPCAEGFRWYLRNGADHDTYQQLLDALVAEGRVDDACWLLDQFGPTDAVRVLDHIEASAMVFAGTLQVRSHVDVDTIVRAGRDLKVTGGIRAGRAIVAGGDINSEAAIACGGPISAGEDLLVAWNVQAEGDVTARRVRVGWNLFGQAGLRSQGDLSVGHTLQIAGGLDSTCGVRVGQTFDCGARIHVGHGVECGENLLCEEHIEVGWGIRAGGAIRAEGGIRAGESICAGEEIEVGQGYGIYAGLAVRTDAWEVSAQVRASRPPAALKSGWWAGSGGLCLRETTGAGLT